MFKAALTLSLCLVSCLSLFAQKEEHSFSNAKPKDYWGVSAIPLVTTKTKINGDPGRYGLKGRRQSGAELLVHYYLNFKENYSLVFSGGMIVFGSRLDYTIPKEMFDPQAASDITPNKYQSSGMQFSNYKVQAELQKRWPGGKNNHWNLAGGLSLLFSFAENAGQTGIMYVYPDGQTKQYLTRYEQVNNNGKPWFNFHVSGGQEWILKSKSIVQLNLKVNFSPVNPATGTYIFTTGIQPDLGGDYKTSGSYIGISTAYFFVGRNKKPK